LATTVGADGRAPAPGLFSITTGWPKALGPAASPSMRAIQVGRPAARCEWHDQPDRLASGSPASGSPAPMRAIGKKPSAPASGRGRPPMPMTVARLSPHAGFPPFCSRAVFLRPAFCLIGLVQPPSGNLPAQIEIHHPPRFRSGRGAAVERNPCRELAQAQASAFISTGSLGHLDRRAEPISSTSGVVDAAWTPSVASSTFIGISPGMMDIGAPPRMELACGLAETGRWPGRACRSLP